MSTKDQYLYMQVDGDQVYRLNMTKFGNGSSPRPEFELLCDYSGDELPEDMICILVGSEGYMVGGQKLQWLDKTTDDNGDEDEDEFDLYIAKFEFLPNFQVFALDLDDQSQSQSLRVCDDLPKMLGPKTHPMVITVDEKIYVLARQPYFEYLKPLPQPVFEVFNPIIGSWKALPHPPWTNPDCNVYHNFAWRHKIVYCTMAGYYTFDTHAETWEYSDMKSPPFPVISGTAVEFKDFLIAMPRKDQQLLAYQLDSHGFIKSCWELCDLWQVFNPHFVENNFQGFVTHFGDDDGDGDGSRRICLLIAGLDECWKWSARVAIIRVYISFDDAGDPVPYSYLETLQHHDINNFGGPVKHINSVFVKYDCLNKHDVEADARFMDANISGLDSMAEIEDVDENEAGDQKNEDHLMLASMFDAPKSNLAVVPAGLEQESGESDGDYIKRLKSFVEKQCSEIQDLVSCNATLAEDLAKAGGGGSSRPEQRASGGSERVQLEILCRDLQEAFQRIETLKTEKAKIESEASMYRNLAGKMESDLKSLSDAYNSLEQANFNLEREVKALKSGEPTTIPDVEAIKAEVREEGQKKRQN